MIRETPEAVRLIPIDRIEVLNSRDRNTKVFEATLYSNLIGECHAIRRAFRRRMILGLADSGLARRLSEGGELGSSGGLSKSCPITLHRRVIH